MFGLNSTLRQLFEGTPDGVIRSAVDTLQEAQKNREVKNPGGFLNLAIRDSWQPNGQLQENDELVLFKKWWPKARKQGLVIGSEQTDEGIYVYTPDGKRLSFHKAQRLL